MKDGQERDRTVAIATGQQKGENMSVAKVSEISATSEIGFEDAVRMGIDRASRTLKGITGAWVSEQKVDVEDGKIVRYRINMRVTFVLED